MPSKNAGWRQTARPIAFDTLEERNAKIDADSEELRQVLAESRSAVTAKDADPWDMEAYDNLKRDLASLQRRRARNDIRTNEAGIPVSASQNRFMDLADRQTRYQTMKDLLTFGPRQRRAPAPRDPRQDGG